jgi:protein-S-isoprenylcysteine O-methyltransferase Ste14
MHSAFSVRLFAILRTAMFAVLFMGTLGIYLPFYLGLIVWKAPRYEWRMSGVVLLTLGAFIALRCAFAFAWTGEGTPAPFDPPRHLVVTGWYRYVRNPMYIGFALFLIGEFLLFGTSLEGAFEYMVVLAVCVTIFVLTYEEPTLRRKFPDDYAEYFRNVPRFLPRRGPWEPQKTKGAASSQR